jgi:hypothetical protein
LPAHITTIEPHLPFRDKTRSELTGKDWRRISGEETSPEEERVVTLEKENNVQQSGGSSAVK